MDGQAGGAMTSTRTAAKAAAKTYETMLRIAALLAEMRSQCAFCERD
jgi:hypothetical protein